MNATRLSEGFVLALALVLVGLTGLLFCAALMLVFLGETFAWIELPACWAALEGCSGLETAAFFLLLYVAATFVVFPIGDFISDRLSPKLLVRHPKLRPPLCAAIFALCTTILAILLATGAYVYFASGAVSAAYSATYIGEPTTSYVITQLVSGAGIAWVAIEVVFRVFRPLCEILSLLLAGCRALARRIRQRFQRESV